MRVFVQCGISGLPFNETVFSTYHGFSEMGAEIEFYKNVKEIENITRER